MSFRDNPERNMIHFSFSYHTWGSQEREREKKKLKENTYYSNSLLFYFFYERLKSLLYCSLYSPLFVVLSANRGKGESKTMSFLIPFFILILFYLKLLKSSPEGSFAFYHFPHRVFFSGEKKSKTRVMRLFLIIFVCLSVSFYFSCFLVSWK